MKHVLLSLVMFSLFLHLTAQEQVYFNQRIDHYNNKDNSDNIIETDSGYVIGGYTYDPDPYYEYEIKLTFTGLTYEGEEIFFKKYGYDSINTFLGQPGSLIRSSKDRFISVGTWRTFTENFVDSKGMLACYNSSFDTLWTRLYGEKALPHDTAFMLDQVKKTTDNGLIMTGHRNPSSKFHLWLIKTDSLGNKQWETFIGDGVEYYAGYSVVQTEDGGYVIGGYNFKIGVSGSGDPLIIKTDSLGNEEWRINPGNPEVDDNKVMVALAADGNIIAGTNYGTQSSGDNQWMVVKVMKITPSGEVLWDYNYGEPGYDNFLANTIVLDNGNIITNGGESIFEENKPRRISWILCVDSMGNELWYREYTLLNGQNSYNRLYDVIQSTDNGLIGCGMVKPGLPYDTGTHDIWVMKMDSMGCLAAACDTTVDVISYFESESSGFSIYPNPVREVFTVAFECETTETIHLHFYDMFGVKVKEVVIPIGKQSVIVNSTGWIAGVYFAILSSKHKPAASLKFVVRR